MPKIVVLIVAIKVCLGPICLNKPYIILYHIIMIIIIIIQYWIIT